MHGVNDAGYLNVLNNVQAPSAGTCPANRITFTSATLNSLVDANQLPTNITLSMD